MTAFSLKESDQFLQRLLIYLATFLLAAPVTVFYSYTEQRLALLWRLWLSRTILRKYFAGLAFYKVSWYEGIDNPDQRIEEDVRNFCSTTLSLFLIACNSILTLVLFIGILWSISFYLIIGVIVYSVGGSLITFWIGKPLVNLNFSQLKKEADYRYKLVNVRDNAESIAFYRGQRKEFTRVRQRLKKALENFRKIINLNRNLGFFITTYNNFKPVLPLIIVSPLYLRGQIEFGVVTQSADAFVRVVEALSILIVHFGTISSVAALATRLGSFIEILEDAHQVETGKNVIETIEEPLIAVRGVTIIVPNRDQTLVRNLSFEQQEGGLMISGTSGTGKSSVFRVLAGLWKRGSGQVVRPPLSDCVFLPQKPYLVIGSLRNQLFYTLHRRVASDEEIMEILKKVGLSSIVKRVGSLGEFADWGSLLSVGEQQQLAFARLLLTRPKYVFLDESTTAVEPRVEARLYQQLQKQTRAYVSITNREALYAFHDSVIEIKDDGTWEQRSLRKS
jgi:putative ATP-binding cassette transporter